MKHTSIIVKTKSKSYPIYFGNNVISSLGSLVKKNIPQTKKIFIKSSISLNYLNRSLQKQKKGLFR